MRQVNQLRCILLGSALGLLLLPGLGPNRIKAEQPLSSEASIAEQYLLSAANRERMSRGLQPLRRDPVLAQAAAFHARQMANHSNRLLTKVELSIWVTA